MFSRFGTIQAREQTDRQTRDNSTSTTVDILPWSIQITTATV